MRNKRLIFSVALLCAFVAAGFAGPALADVTMSLVPTDSMGTPANNFASRDTVIVDIEATPGTGIAGCAFMLEYDANVLTPPQTDAEGLPADPNDITTSFPFTFTSTGDPADATPTNRVNADNLGVIYFSGATIDPTDGGAIANPMNPLFSVKFLVKDGAALGDTVINLKQTMLWNPLAGYGTLKDGTPVTQDIPFDDNLHLKESVPVLVGAVDKNHGDFNDLTKAFPVLLDAADLATATLNIEACTTQNVTGTVTYGGDQAGTLRIAAQENNGTRTGNVDEANWDKTDSPDAYTLPLCDGTFTVTAYLDADGGGTMDAWEASGAYGMDVVVDGMGVLNVDMTLTDPAINGVPLWWLQANGLPLDVDPATTDTDKDGYSDKQEQINGTNPNQKDAPFGTGYVAGTNEEEPYQKVIAENVTAKPGTQDVAVKLTYETTNAVYNDGDWLDVLVCYDPTKVTFDQANASAHATDLQVGPVSEDDTEDVDGNPATTKMVHIGWDDWTDAADWPGGAQPDPLATLVFDLLPAFTGGTTPLNVVVQDGRNTTGYTFLSTDGSITAQTFNLDVDNNGEVKPLTDGLLVIRYLFNYHNLVGETWTTGAVGAGADRDTSAEIVDFLASAVDDGSLDIDGNGEIKPLTDGLLIIRYLFNYHNLVGDTWTTGAVGAGATRDTAAAIEAYLDSLIP